MTIAREELKVKVIGQGQSHAPGQFFLVFFRNHTSDLHLYPWLGPPLAALRCYAPPVLWMTSCFFHNEPYGGMLLSVQRRHCSVVHMEASFDLSYTVL